MEKKSFFYFTRFFIYFVLSPLGWIELSGELSLGSQKLGFGASIPIPKYF
jgi:hypothetical protein